MAEQQTQAASSPAEAPDPFNGLEPTHQEFSDWRETGKLAERFKPAEPAESAPADTPEKTVEAAEGEGPENAPDSEPEKAQEPPQKVSPAEKRIKQLLAEKKELERKLADSAKPDAKPASSAAQNQQQADQSQYTRPKPKPDANGPDGKPYETYEDYVEDLAKWSGEQQLVQYQRQQAEQQAQAAIRAKMDDARSRYADAEETIIPASKAISEAPISPVVKKVIEDSDFFLDLLYVAGSDPDELQKFIALAQRDPRGAIGMVFEYERGIKEERAKNGKAGTAPEKKKTQAPPPPDPVSRASGRSFDVNDDSISDDEWMRKRRAQVAAK